MEKELVPSKCGKVSEIPYKVQTTNRENHQDFKILAYNSSSYFFMRIHINPLKANTEPPYFSFAYVSRSAVELEAFHIPAI